jgi:hypothetical protein
MISELRGFSTYSCRKNSAEIAYDEKNKTII